MRKIAFLFFVLLFLAACGQHTAALEEVNSISATAGYDESFYNNEITNQAVVIAFETIQATIPLPKDWEIVPMAGSSLPGVERTYNVRLIPPNGESLAIVTIGNNMTLQRFTPEAFSVWYSALTEPILPRAVEEAAQFERLSLYNGSAVFAIFTDADLVGQTPPPDEYLYLGMFLGSWDNGFLAHASLLTNDTDSFDFNLMLFALSMMELSFNQREGSLTIEHWEEMQAVPVYDLVGLNLVNHNLENSDFLMEHILESTQNGEHFSVPVISGGEPYRPYRHGTDEVIWNAGGIGMLYYLLPNADIHTLLDSEVSGDIHRLQRDGFVVNAKLPFRVSLDKQMAVFGFSMELHEEPNAVYIYIFQNIPDSEYVLFLLCILFPNYWSGEDAVILAELGAHIGLDLLAYWPW